MALADFAGGVQDALRQLVADRMVRTKMEHEQKMADARLRMAESQLGLEQAQNRRATEQFELTKAETRRKAAGEEEHARQRALYFNALPPHVRPAAEGQDFGVNLKPEDFLDPGQAREQRIEDIEAEAAARRRGDPPRPEKPERIPKLWILRGGKPVRVSDDDIQPGDAPYEKASTTGLTGPSQYAIETATRTIRAVDQVLPKIGAATAGPLGAIGRRIPGTAAANVSADLSSVASNVAFNALQAMREASKTGGALGQVSERELDLLSSVEGSIRQDQSPANLRKNLLLIKESQRRWLTEAKRLGADIGEEDNEASGAGEYNWVNGKLVPRQ